MKIALGGFSQGGHLALHVVYGQKLRLGATFSLSSFLCNNSTVFENQRLDESPPLFASCGSEDSMVSSKWVQSTVERLQSLGVDVTFSVRPHIGHEIEKQQISQLFTWINKYRNFYLTFNSVQL